MTKKDLKKAKVNIRAGYYHGSYCIFDVDIDTTIPFPEYSGVNGEPVVREKTIARIDAKQIEDFLGKRIRGGLFEFGEKGRKYQYIILK